jgi:hypothetical protein
LAVSSRKGLKRLWTPDEAKIQAKQEKDEIDDEPLALKLNVMRVRERR